MLTSSYPRFPGDGIGTFVEPIAHGVAALGREVHIVAPWHPLITRPPREGDVHFHFYRYAPLPSLHLFGYAAALRADIALRPTAYLVTPVAVAAGLRAVRRVVKNTGASLLHAHWVVPSGFIAALGASGLPLVISLHGSDVFLAETNRMVRVGARYAFKRAGWITACSEDLRRRAVRIGAREERSDVVPYGVDTSRFKPDPVARRKVRGEHGLGDADAVVFAVGRLVRKKGFEFLIDAISRMRDLPQPPTLFIAGSGDLEPELRQRTARRGVEFRVSFLGAVLHDQVADWFAAADVAVVPSVHDDAGNVDGLPNTLLEALSSGTPVVTTSAGGTRSVAIEGRTARVVAERDSAALADAITALLSNPSAAAALAQEARKAMCQEHDWARVAQRFDDAYTEAARAAAVGAITS